MQSAKCKVQSAERRVRSCSFIRVIAMRGHYVGTVVPDGPCTAFIIAERTVREAGPYKHTFSYIAMIVMHTDSEEQRDAESASHSLWRHDVMVSWRHGVLAP